MERREIDSQERSNSPIAKNKIHQRSSGGAGGWETAPRLGGRRGLGWQRRGPSPRVGSFVWGRKGEERFGLLGKVVVYHGRKVLRGMFRTFTGSWTRRDVSLGSHFLSF